jgi:hypothetical protein
MNFGPAVGQEFIDGGRVGRSIAGRDRRQAPKHIGQVPDLQIVAFRSKTRCNDFRSVALIEKRVLGRSTACCPDGRPLDRPDPELSSCRQPGPCRRSSWAGSSEIFAAGRVEPSRVCKP